jgi:hypothetical protein
MQKRFLPIVALLLFGCGSGPAARVVVEPTAGGKRLTLPDFGLRLTVPSDSDGRVSQSREDLLVRMSVDSGYQTYMGIELKPVATTQREYRASAIYRACLPEFIDQSENAEDFALFYKCAGGSGLDMQTPYHVVRSAVLNGKRVECTGDARSLAKAKQYKESCASLESASSR